MSQGDFKQLYEDFGNHWLTTVSLSGITKRHLARNQAFFQRLADGLDSVEALKTANLVDYFSPDELQRHFHIVSWLLETGRCRANSRAELVDAAERLAQTQILRQTRTQWKLDLLVRFEGSLRRFKATGERRGWHGEDAVLQLRTITLLLRAAWRFLEGLPESVVSVQAIDQGSVDAFIVEFPGHRDSFRRFIRYLNQEETLFNPLLGPFVDRPFPVHLLRPPEEANKLLVKWLEGTEDTVRERLLCILMLVFARQAKAACSLRRQHFSVGPKGTVEARFGKIPVALPGPIAALVLQHLGIEERRRGRPLVDEDYLFPGRMSGQPLHPGSLRPFTIREGVSARSLYTTSLASYYREGLRLPSILSQTLGITKTTAIRYYQAFAPEQTEEALFHAGRR
ncbi:hypothetical protein [Roseateles sp. L2-2]|uniref:hypothetical protein n=1 Tax=Roseateles sp. L2-2 TaxID=3422597 RepID=UPI003D363F89